MISLKDYTVLYSDYFNNSHHNQNQIKPCFSYLYPSQIQPLNKRKFINEKQEMLTVTQLESLQQCEALIEIIKSTYEQILSPSQEFCIIEHKNPNAQKRFLAIASDIQLISLKKLAQNHFFQNINVPSEQFCTYLIERIFQFYHLLEGKGFHLKVITPEHIVVYQDQIFLNYPFPHDIFNTHGRCFLQQLQEWRCFCAPEILKVFNTSLRIEETQIKKATTIMQHSDPTYYSQNYEGKDFKKAILYSLGLTIFYCFGFHIPLQDRLKALKSPNNLNNFMNELRREIKIHHEGKFISKLLKLMLEHSQSLRDTITTFTYKMNSIQFRLLRRMNSINKKVLTNQDIVMTQSQANNNSQPFIMNSAKKTIDIRISSSIIISNSSSGINKSWLTASQQNPQGKSSCSPSSQLNKSQQDDKQHQRERISNSKKLLITTELNQIKQIEETIKQPSSPIELDIQWDDDSLMRGSNNKSNKDKSKSSSDKEKKDKRLQLLNRISEKEEAQEEVEVGGAMNDVGDQFLGSNLQYNISEQQNNLSLAKVSKLESHISKSEIGSRPSQSIEAKNSMIINIDKRISGTQTRLNSKHLTVEQQEIGSVNLSKNKKNDRQQSLKQQIQTQINPILTNKNPSHSKSSSVDQPSTMSLFSKNSMPIIEQLQNQSSLNQSQHPNDYQNQSIIFQQPFFNDQEFKIQQKLIKEKKDREKDKLTERKKDQYNYRSRVILLALVVICTVFKLVDYLMTGGK